MRTPSLLGDQSSDDATSFDSDSDLDGSVDLEGSVDSGGSVDVASPILTRLDHLETLSHQTRDQLNALQRRLRTLERRVGRFS